MDIVKAGAPVDAGGHCSLEVACHWASGVAQPG